MFFQLVSVPNAVLVSTLLAKTLAGQTHLGIQGFHVAGILYLPKLSPPTAEFSPANDGWVHNTKIDLRIAIQIGSTIPPLGVEF